MKADEQYIDVDGEKLYVQTAGDKNGKPLLMVHGFPDNSNTWKFQINELVNSGFYLVMPDQRGYHLSSHNKKANTKTLTSDLLAIMEHLGFSKFFVVGHDWGGIAAWQLASNNPERIERAVILNVNHIDAFGDFSFRLIPQFFKSWYVLVMQLPIIGRFLLYPALITYVGLKYPHIRKSGYRFQMTGKTSSIHAFSYYRSAMRYVLQKRQKRKNNSITVPIRLLWATRDVALTDYVAKKSVDFCAEGSMVTVPSSTHWSHWDNPRFVNNQIIDFLNS